MPKKDDERKVILENTSSRHIIWDRHEGPIDTVMFKPGGSVCLTADQVEKMGKLPPGVVPKEYRPGDKHDPKKGRIG